MAHKVKVGYMKCETRKCANGDGGDGRVSVMKNDKGTLTYSCDECGSAPYVRPGSGQHAAWLRDLTPVPGAPAPAPAPAAAPKPAPKEKEKKPAAPAGANADGW